MNYVQEINTYFDAIEKSAKEISEESRQIALSVIENTVRELEKIKKRDPEEQKPEIAELIMKMVGNPEDDQNYLNW